MTLLCTHCNTNTLHNDSALGLVFCTSCGNISSESIPTSTLTFSKTSTDTQLNGQLISLSTNTIFFNTRIQDVLETLCTNMSLPLSYAQMSYRWYKLALQHNLSKGKALLYTLSACVYITCRIEHLPVMIVDFSACLRISASGIGKMYKKLCKTLGIKVSMNDPSFYIPKYISQLNLCKNDESTENSADIDEPENEDSNKENIIHNIEHKTTKQCKNNSLNISKKYSVLYMANRIVRWMKRDWITAGRRPNNVCGAAILIASRICGNEKTIEDIARVVKGGINTIQKRLKEIGDTATAEMTVEDFVQVWIEREEDPPLEKKRMKMMIKENYKKNKAISCHRQSAINEEDAIKKYDVTKIKQIQTNNTEMMGETAHGINGNHTHETDNTQTMYTCKLNDTKIYNDQCFLHESDDDSEINDCILPDSESKQRESIWNEKYEDYMKEKENKPVLRVKKKKDVKKVVEKKRSSKLNYSVLDNLI